MQRCEFATTRVQALLAKLERDGVNVAVIGSLARGQFSAHSDVDLLVRGPLDPASRTRIERTVADAFRGASIPYDLIFATDVTAERLVEFENDLIEASRICEVSA